MNLLYYSWKSNNDSIIQNQFLSLGHDIVVCSLSFSNYVHDPVFIDSIVRVIKVHKIDAIFSINFFPLLAKVCDITHLEYYSWVYDSPNLTLFTSEVNLPCNHIGVFDKAFVEYFKVLGITTVFHLPLAVDVPFFISKIDNPQYKTFDISFVGSLYNNNFYDTLDVSFPVRECSDEIINNLAFSSSELSFENAFPSHDEDIQSYICSEWYRSMQLKGLTLGNDYFCSNEYLVSYQIFDRKITETERTLLLEKIATKYPKDLCVFTDSNTSKLSHLHKCNKGIVNYSEEMPLVFNRSKININVTSRSIRSGIPLRILDILACKGFVLTNYRPELSDYFEIGKDIEVFYNVQDCIEKIKYYLEHDEERKAILVNGHRKVIDLFNYPSALSKLFNA